MLWLWILLGVIGLLLLILIVLFIIVNIVHNKLFNKRYTPLDIDSYTKEEFNLKYKKLEINHNGKYIRGYFYYYDNYDDNKLIIFSHGMDSSKESYLQEIAYIAKNGFMVLGFDYFGTNESDGLLKGFGNSLYSLNVVMNYLKSNDEYKSKDIYVIGHSWGGYAALNIVNLHKNIKGIVALAPAVSFKRTLRDSYIKQNILITSMMMLVEKLKFGKYSLYDGKDSINNYDGRVMVIQSKNDNVLPYRSSLEYIKNNTKKDIEYIILEDRYHNPDYKKSAVDKLNNFYNEMRNYKGNDIKELFSKQDFRAMGELDSIVMDKIINFLKR